MKNRRLKWMIAAALVLISLGTIAALTVFAFRSRHRANDFNEGAALFKAGNYAKARPFLLRTILRDRSNEEAFRMLAEIAESEHDYPMVLVCLRQAAGLNPLDRSRQTRLAAMLAATGNYPELLELLKNRKDLNEIELAAKIEALAVTGDLKQANTLLAAAKTETSIELQLARAVVAMRERKFEDAFKLADGIARDNAASTLLKVRAFQIAGTAAATLGRQPQAEAAFTRAAELAPRAGLAPLAGCLLAAGKSEAAAEVLEKLVDLDSDNGPAILQLTDLYAAASQADRLAELRKKCKPRTRAGIEAVNYLDAVIAGLDGRYAEAGKLLELAPGCAGMPLYHLLRAQSMIAAEELGPLGAELNALLRIAPTPESKKRVEEMLAPLLRKLVEAGDRQKAEQAALLLLSVTDTPSPIRRSALIVALQGAFSRNESPKVITLATQLLKLEPGNALANLAMAQALLATGNAIESLPYLKPLPATPATLLLEAAARYQLGESKAAAEALEKAWKLAPGTPEIFVSYGGLLLEEKQFDRLRELAKEMPDTPEAKFAANSLLARAAEAEKQNPEPFRLAALKAAGQLPDTPEIRYNRAYLLAVSDRNKEAAELYRELHRDYPEWELVIVNLSEVEAALGNPHEALLLAEKAVRLNPKWEAAQECLKRRRAEKKAAQKLK